LLNSQKKLVSTEIKLNRLRSQKAALKHRLKQQNNTERRARTRTLIQIGGLVTLTPLPTICSLDLGDDLQLEHQAKAALLLGVLAELSENLPPLSEDDLTRLREKGLNMLKKAR
jgi:hypothetical protein